MNTLREKLDEHHERLVRLLLALDIEPTGNYALDYSISVVNDQEETIEFRDEIIGLLQDKGAQLKLADALVKAVANGFQHYNLPMPPVIVNALKNYQEAGE